MQVNVAASTSKGSANTFFADAVTTVTQIKSTAGQLYLLDLMNGVAATSYLQVFFQPSASVTLGTTVPDLVIKLPTNGGSGFTKTIAFPVPVGAIRPASAGAGTGLSVAGTTTATGASTAAIGVTALYL